MLQAVVAFLWLWFHSFPLGNPASEALPLLVMRCRFASVLVSTLSLCVGISLVFLSLGLLAELLVAYTGRESDNFSIAERTAAPAAREFVADS